MEEAQLLALQREKREVHAMTIAMSALFDQKALTEYSEAVDKVIREKSTTSGEPQSINHSFGELSKLNELLGGN